MLLGTAYINTCHVLLLLLTVPMWTALSSTQISAHLVAIVDCIHAGSAVTVAQDNSTNQTADGLVEDPLQPPLDLVTVSQE